MYTVNYTAGEIALNYRSPAAGTIATAIVLRMCMLQKPSINTQAAK